MVLGGQLQPKFAFFECLFCRFLVGFQLWHQPIHQLLCPNSCRFRTWVINCLLNCSLMQFLGWCCWCSFSSFCLGGAVGDGCRSWSSGWNIFVRMLSNCSKKKNGESSILDFKMLFFRHTDVPNRMFHLAYVY